MTVDVDQLDLLDELRTQEQARGTTTIVVDQSVADAIAKARAARDAGMAQAQEADRDGWDTKVIDQAIAALVATGQRFSANDLRQLLPDVRQPLIGKRVRAAATRGETRRVDYVPSSLESTHGHPIAVWVRANHS